MDGLVWSRVLWIGGAPDSGKTSVTRAIASRHGLAVYEYDTEDLAHHEKLAKSDETYADFLLKSIDQRWVETTPAALFERAMRSFDARFPLVLDDLRRLAERGGGLVLAEGFGLTPALVAPLLEDVSRAVWLVPSLGFKEESMRRRNKPSFRDKTSDPVRALRNLLERDLMIAAAVADQARSRALSLIEVDGTRGLQEIVAKVEAQFSPFL